MAGSVVTTKQITYNGAPLNDVLAGLNPSYQRVVNPLDAPYGARGDGMGDDGPALRLAMAAAILSERPLYIPAGVYNIETGQSLYAINISGVPIRIYGAGRDLTKIYCASGYGLGGIALTDCPSFEICDLEIDGNWAGQVSPPGTHNIRIGSTAPNSQDSGLIRNVTLRNSNCYGIGFATKLGGYKGVHVDHAWIYSPQNDGIDTKDHADNEFLHFTNIHVEFPSQRSGDDAGIDLRGSFNVDNITVKLDPNKKSCGVRTRFPGETTGPVGGHDSNLSNLNIDMGGQGTAFSRKGLDLGGIRNNVTGANVRNGWSDGVNTTGTTGVYLRPQAGESSLVNIHVRDQSTGFYIGAPNAQLTNCHALGCSTTDFVTTVFASQGDGFKFVIDTANANVLLRDNGINCTLINCRSEGFTRSFVESQVTGTGSGNRLVSCRGVTPTALQWASTYTSPAFIIGGDLLGQATKLSQGATDGTPGVQIDYTAGAASGLRVIGTSGNPRLLPVGSATNLGIELRGKGTAGGELVDGGGVRRVRTSTTGVAFQGSAPVAVQALPAAATDAATTQALANALRTALINYGLCS